LSSLAVASFLLRSSIFLLATLKYFSSFSLFRPLLLPCATFTDDVPASDSDSDCFLGTYRVFFLALAVAFTSRFLTGAVAGAATTFVSGITGSKSAIVGD